MAEREYRLIDATEVRAAGGTGDADPLRLEGTASVFDRFAQLRGFKERIRPGAFTRAISEGQDVVCLWNHNTDIVLGRTSNDTLRLKQTNRGLEYVVDLPNTSAGRDAHESVRRKDVNGCSFGFSVPEGGQAWSEGRSDDGTFFVQRDVIDVNLMDVSPVTYPAYSGTDVQARSVEAPLELRSAVERKNKELLGAAVVPPIKEPKMSFEIRAVVGIDDCDINPQDCPASWSDELKTAYCAGYNAAYKKAHEEEGLKGNAAIAKAISGGMMGIHEILARPDQSGSAQPPAAQADTDLDNDAVRKAARVAELRDADSLEDFICTLNAALSERFPWVAPAGGTDGCGPYVGSGKYYIVETFIDHVIVSEGGPGDNYSSIPYTYVPDGDDDYDIIFGEPAAVDRTWVPSERAKAVIAEYRDAEDELDDDFDSFLMGREFDDNDVHANHMDGNCEESECACQNRWCPSSSSMRSVVVGVTVRFASDFKFEKRAGMTRTKRVAGKDLAASSFAYVGDPDKTETWKFPIMDAAHVRNALSRWGQATGIPEGSKAGVLSKIQAAAKKFGITVSDDRSAEDAAELRARLAEHMLRVGPDFEVRLDQPRKDGGKFGTTDGEKASSDQEHTSAAQKHFAQAAEHDKKGENAAANAHYAAADAHVDAAKARAMKEQDASQRSDIANAHSKVANNESVRCSM